MLCTLLLLFSVQYLKAQQGNLKITTYTESDGLSSSIIRCVLQDSRGMLWIGTPDGLNTYDGYSFNTLRKSSTDENTIKNNFITLLSRDQVGDIWIGYMQEGISNYNLATGKFRHYSLQQEAASKTKTSEVTCLFVDRKNIVWIGVKQNGLYKLDKNTGSFVRYNLTDKDNNPVAAVNNTVYAITEDDAGVFWMATKAGLYRFTPSVNEMKALRNSPLQDGVLNKELFVNIRKEDDVLWLSAWTGGLYAYNTRNSKWQNYTYAPEFMSHNIVMDAMPQHGTDSLLIVTNDKGPGFFNKKTGKFNFIYNNDKSISKDYKSMYKDRVGNIWITSNRGLMKIGKQSTKFLFNDFKVSYSSNNDIYFVYDIYENDDYIFYGTWYADGLKVRNKKSGKEYTLAVETLPEEEKNILITDIAESRSGDVWILSRDVVYFFDKKLQQLKRKYQPASQGNPGRGNFFIALVEAGDGKMWVATLRNGIFVYDKLGDTIVRHYAPGIPGSSIPVKYISSLHNDNDGVMWIGGSEGFFGYADQNGNIHEIPLNISGMIVGAVNSISSTPDNKIWIGTDIGLLQFNTAEKRVEKIYTSENGIYSDIVDKVFVDKNGEVWCITQSTLCKVNYHKGIVNSYGIDQGLEKPLAGKNLSELQNGYMMIPASGGYYLFHPDSLNVVQKPFPVVITSFMVKGEPRFYGNDLGKYQKILLQPAESHFSFEFASIDFNRTAKQRYAYMLEGFDKDWRNTYNRYAAYANLPPGNYNFKVRAVGSTANEIESTTVLLPLQVSGYFYNTNTFRIIVLITILGIMYLVYSIRLRNQKRLFLLKTKAGLLEKEKAMIMYESLKQKLNPHFLFNSLTSLSSLIRINQKMAGEFLDGLSKTYRYILNNREKDLVPLAEELSFSQTYIKLQKTRFENGLIVNIHIQEECLHMKIAPVTLQNLLENAIKHNVVTEDEPLMIDIYTNELNQLIVQNNLNKKHFVETSNRQGLAGLRSLYSFLSERQIEVQQTLQHFIVKVPLL